MKRTTFNTIKFPSGPWTSEPNFLEGTDDATGYAMCIRRGPVGNLCGYVGIPISHPAYGKHYDEIGMSMDIHGGLTYSGEEDDLTWFGFDCAHCGDFCPGLLMNFESDSKYRDIEYVKAQAVSLAAQLKLLEEQ